MKYCIYCGERMSDEMKFCTHCGLKQPEDGLWEEESLEEELLEEELPEEKPYGKRSDQASAGKHTGSLLAVFLIAAAAAVIALFLYKEFGVVRTFDAFAGMEISLSGTDHYGEITISKTGKEEMYSRLEYTADKAQNLSNGEIVVVTVSDRDGGSDFSEFRKAYHRIPEAITREYTVAGLDELTVFDAFEDLSVRLTGAEPNGRITVENLDVENGLRYEADRYEGLSNGDTVTIRVVPANGGIFDAEYAEQYHRMPERTEKYIAIDGLNAYPERPEDIPEAFMEVMKREAEDRFRAYTDTDWNSSRDRLDRMTFKGAYLLTAKDPAATSPPNRLYLIYEAQATAMSGEEKKGITFWFCALFENIVKNSDGSYTVDLENVKITDNLFSTGVSGHHYRGYPSLEALVNTDILSRQGEYRSEMDMAG